MVLVDAVRNLPASCHSPLLHGAEGPRAGVRTSSGACSGVRWMFDAHQDFIPTPEVRGRCSAAAGRRLATALGQTRAANGVYETHLCRHGLAASDRRCAHVMFVRVTQIALDENPAKLLKLATTHEDAPMEDTHIPGNLVIPARLVTCPCTIGCATSLQATAAVIKARRRTSFITTTRLQFRRSQGRSTKSWTTRGLFFASCDPCFA